MAGLSQVTRGLGTLDREVFEAVAESPTALLDTAMPVLTRAADHSKLWMAIAALLMKGPRSNRRGAVRGLATLAVTSLFTNQVAFHFIFKCGLDHSSLCRPYGFGYG